MNAIASDEWFGERGASERPIDLEMCDGSVEYAAPDGSVTVLSGVNLRVHRGSLCSIVGPSGCGKSTLLKAFLGIVKLTAGSLSIDAGRRAAGIAYVPQSPALFPWCTVLQNACLGAELRRPLNTVVIERVREDLATFGLAGFEHVLPGALSGGMAQRTAVLRALESRPSILLCDEPFSSVDFVTRLELNTRFKYMCSVLDVTTVFVTHNIEEAIFLGDTVVVMSGRPGRIIKTYSPALSLGAGDAVESRKAPEFEPLFQAIWNDLRPS